MGNYQIVPIGNMFRVIEEGPDGRESSVDGFTTEDDARGWLDSFLILLGLIECMSRKTFPQ
jgi:hypothetical protein